MTAIMNDDAPGRPRPRQNHPPGHPKGTLLGWPKPERGPARARRRRDRPMEGRPVFADDVAWDRAQEELEAHGLGDGLPLVPPTAARLAAMLAGLAAPDASLGPLPPLFGELTARAAAHDCVMAGAPPGALPVVMTALRACLADEFNLLGLLTTTGTPAVAVCVHGPIAKHLEMNDATNCLGPGNRANAAIGRAISLALRNIAGARENVGDMATMGQPGKYGFCFAENREAILPPLAARRGLDADASAVTVMGVSGTIEVLPDVPGDSPATVLDPVARAMTTAIAVSGADRDRPRGEQVFLLPPELARLLVARGEDLGGIQAKLFEAAGAPASSPAAFHPIVTGGAGVKMTHLPLWGGGTLPQTRPLLDLGA